MAPTVHYLNLEYFLVRTYDFVSGLSFPLSAIPHWFVTFVHIVIYLGMGLSLIFLVLVVYAQIMMVQTEHEGFHAMEEEEHEAVAAAAHEPTAEPRTISRWDAIMALATGTNDSDWRRAILEADIMMSDALTEKGFTGVTVADQLRMANPFQMRTLSSAWEAHKMRNKVAHEGNTLVLTERDVQTTIDQYKRVFEEFGVL